LLVFAGMGFHRQLWRYAGLGQYSVLVAGTLIQTAFLVIAQGFIQITISRAAYLIYFFLITGLVIGTRLSFNAARNSTPLKRNLHRLLPGLMTHLAKKNAAALAELTQSALPAKRLLIIGAGESGSEVIRELHRHNETGTPVVVLDKDPNKRGYKILGVPVFGDLTRLSEAVVKYRVDEVVLALRRASPAEIRPIVDCCHAAGVPLKTVPHLSDLIGGQIQVSALKTFEIQDLLGRDEIALNLEQIAQYLKDETVLVTGAGGSIGAELCRQIVQFQPHQLLLFDNNEVTARHTLEMLQDWLPALTEAQIVIGSVRDLSRLDQVMTSYRPTIVFHAAGYHDCTILDGQAEEAVKTNVFGTYNLALHAVRAGVGKFVLISSSQAVNPTHVIGATRRIAELVVQNLSRRFPDTLFAAVRLGTVLGTSDGLDARLQRQIAQSKRVVLHDAEQKRYLMTLSESVSLIIQAGALAEGGEVFVLDTGEPTRLLDLVQDMVRLSGLAIGRDVTLESRAEGACVHTEPEIEQLHLAYEVLRPTAHQKIQVYNPVRDEELLWPEIDSLTHVIGSKQQEINNLLLDMITDKLADDSGWPEGFTFEGKKSLVKNPVRLQGPVAPATHPRIYLASPHMSDEGYEQAFVQEAFDTNWITSLGKNVTEFERELAQYVGTDSAAAFTSGTASIHLALKACGVGAGDIVFCQSLTFAATTNPILYQNAVPVFIDSDEQTWNMDPAALAEAFQKYPQVKAVIVVHLYGFAADMDPIVALCREHGVTLIEDAAESLGATYKGQPTGTFGDYGIFSFNGNKIITASGGGMLVSKNAERIAKTRFWATQARDQARHYQHTEIGYNYRMSNIDAGIGRGQLRVLDQRVAKKKYIYEFYKRELSHLEGVHFQPVNDWNEPNYWLSCLTLDGPVQPLQIMEALEKENIESRPIWKPMHLQPVFAQYDFVGSGVAERIFETGVCLPSDTKMGDADLYRVCGIIRGLWGEEAEVNPADTSFRATIQKTGV
ncbi:MAG: SDR family NAD(P)-dependent oxidoreductase, partial [Clostridia bacterium]|nr:SDR family NAD(P)-dependent oxidoreductase [Clostridia bacterium]